MYLKTYESLFGGKVSKKEIDRSILEDLLQSDLDHLYDNFFERINDYYTNFELFEVNYRTDRNGSVLIEEVESIVKNVPCATRYQFKPGREIFKGFYSTGLCMFVLQTEQTSHRFITDDERIEITHKIYDSINKDRLSDYGIGCCFFREVLKHYPEIYGSPEKLLFYPI